MEEIITLDTIRTIILDILAERRKKDLKHNIKFYILYAIIIASIIELAPIADKLTQKLTGFTGIIAGLAIIIIPIAIIVYLYRKITKF